MAPLNKETRASRNRSWRDCIGIALDEALLALEESFYDLDKEQVWSRPIPDRHSIGTMIMHLLQNLEQHACRFQTGVRVAMVDHSHFDMWASSPDDLVTRQRSVDLPSVTQMQEWLCKIREQASAGLEKASEDDLRGPRAASGWCKEHDRTAGDAYTRTIFHTMAHVRQIWCMRGVLGAFGSDAWPTQFYA